MISKSPTSQGLLCLGLGDLLESSKRRSAVTFGTVLPVSLGSHGDFLTVGDLHQLFEGRGEGGGY